MKNMEDLGPRRPSTGPSSMTPDATAKAPSWPKTAGEAASKLTEHAQEAGSELKETAASLASEAGAKAMGLMNQQFAVGAHFVNDVAKSVRAAADNLESNAPQLARLVRNGADKVEEFSDSLRDQTGEELLRSASDLVRRKPALVFSAAAACGFVLFRVFKAGSSVSTNSRQDYSSGQTRGQVGRVAGLDAPQRPAKRSNRPVSTARSTEEFHGA
jgi:uncharacterized phage infection (PIP) family protein YhgE